MTLIQQPSGRMPTNIVKDVMSWKAFIETIASEQATTGSYVDLADSIIGDIGGMDKVVYAIACVTQNSFYKVLGSLDNSAWTEVVAENGIVAGVTEFQEIDPALYRYYKIQIKEDVAGGSVSAEGFAQ